MAEFVDVVRQANRMCASYERCSDCPAFDVCVFDAYILKSPVEVCNHEKFERITMKWAAEHPKPQYPTWKEWQERMFPNATIHIKPCEFEYRFPCGCKSCDKCRDQPIPADIAEKLGIKPKEA